MSSWCHHLAFEAARIHRVWLCLLAAGLITGLLGSACPRENATVDPGNDTGGDGGTDNGGGGGTAVNGLVEVPDPLSGDNPVYRLTTTGVPAPGASVGDTQFGTTQARVVATPGVRHEYSRFDPFNQDGSMILLMVPAAGERRVYQTQTLPYDQDANLIRTLDIVEPRWDPANPNLIWGLRDFQILTVDVQTGQETIVKDFTQDVTIAPILQAHPDLYRITTQEEGESSADKRYWAFMLQGSNEDYRPRYVFTWDRQLDQIPGLYPLSAAESRVDWVGMSPLGNWVLLGGDWDNGGQLIGLTMANRELTQFHTLDYNFGHSDVGLDSEGREVIVGQSNRSDYVDMLPLSLDTQPIAENGGSYDNTGRVRLIRLYVDYASPLSLNSSVHISCNASGWCVVSTFTEPNLPEQNWLDRTITLVRLDPVHPRVFYLAKVHGTSGAYWEETQATISNDGRKIVWATNWNQNVGQEQVWDMQLTLPTHWQDTVIAQP